MPLLVAIFLLEYVALLFYTLLIIKSSQFCAGPAHTKTDTVHALKITSLQFHPPNLHYYQNQTQYTLLPAPDDITTTDLRDYGPITCN